MQDFMFSNKNLPEKCYGNLFHIQIFLNNTERFLYLIDFNQNSNLLFCLDWAVAIFSNDASLHFSKSVGFYVINWRSLQSVICYEIRWSLIPPNTLAARYHSIAGHFFIFKNSSFSTVHSSTQIELQPPVFIICMKNARI